MYNPARGLREAIARDGTSILELSTRCGLPPEMLEQGMSANWLSQWTRFTEEEITDMGED